MNLLNYKYYILFLLGFFGYGYSVVFSEISSFELYWVSVVGRTAFFGLAVFIIIHDKIYNSLKKKYFIIFLFFWFLLLTRIVFDTTVYPESLRFPISKYYAFALGVSFIPSLSFINFKKKIDVLILGKFIVIMLFPLLLFVLFFEPYTEINNFVRLGSHRFHPIMIGHLAVTSIIVSSFVLRREKEKVFLIGLFLNILLSLIVLFNTQSRGPQLAFLIVLIFIVISQIRNNRSFIFQKRTILTLGLFLIIFIYFFPVLFERLQFTFNSGDGRLLQWKLGVEQFLSSPIYGSGLEIPKFNIYPHNIFIEGFMATGILGGLLFLYLILKPLILVLKNIFSTKEKLLSILFLQYFIASMFSGAIIYNFALWYLSIIIISDD
ncbi:MAG: O-antigen ligase family protein [Arcobacter sp.]|nr:O-antigen ligase family protein [Arcobacter sp.]